MNEADRAMAETRQYVANLLAAAIGEYPDAGQIVEDLLFADESTSKELVELGQQTLNEWNVSLAYPLVAVLRELDVFLADGALAAEDVPVMGLLRDLAFEGSVMAVAATYGSANRLVSRRWSDLENTHGAALQKFSAFLEPADAKGLADSIAKARAGTTF